MGPILIGGVARLGAGLASITAMATLGGVRIVASLAGTDRLVRQLLVVDIIIAVNTLTTI